MPLANVLEAEVEVMLRAVDWRPPKVEVPFVFEIAMGSAKVALPFELNASAAVVEVAVAVEVAMYSEFEIERRVHAFDPAVPSVSASCGLVDEAMVTGHNGVVVPKPVPTAKFIVSPVAPKVSVSPPLPEIVELSSNIKSDPAPTSPMYTSPPAVPTVTVSLPEVVSILNSGAAVVEVAKVHAYGALLGIVEVEEME